MAENNGQDNSSPVWRVPLIILAIIIAIAVVWRIMYAPAPEVAIERPAEPNTVEMPMPPAVIKAPITIDDIVKIRKYWDPAFADWVGKEAPDFELTDTSGNVYKLSSQKGKTVMLVFWATWCRPCIMEIPDLIKIRKETPAENLSIAAISYEQGDKVRSFLSQKPVNYTVIATPPTVMPPPYAGVNAIPAAFFIDKDGIIRLATEGYLLPKETELILEAIGS